MDGLLNPTRLYTRDDVIARPSPVPRRGGVYAWWVKERGRVRIRLIEATPT